VYYNSIKIPIILEIGHNILKSIDSILRTNNLFFNNKVLITSKDIYNQYCSFFDDSEYNKIIEINGGDYKDIEYLQFCEIKYDSILIAFGGGSIIDVVKLFANKTNLPYITIPSTLSNDAIYSPVSRLKVNNKKESYGVVPPVGIIADIEIIKNSPKILLLSGVGDLVSNISALKDWNLSHSATGEKVNAFASILSSTAATSILSFNKYDIKSDRFITALINGLIISGLSMIISSNTRPASGAEHLISHSIDEYYPEKSTFHGIQVAWGQLLLEKYFRNNDKDYRFLKEYFINIGLYELFEDRIRFSPFEVNNILQKALLIRNRYTILNKRNIVLSNVEV